MKIRHTSQQFLRKFSELNWQPEWQWVGSWILLSAFTLLIQSCASAVTAQRGEKQERKSCTAGQGPTSSPSSFYGIQLLLSWMSPWLPTAVCSFLNKTFVLLLDYFTDKYCTRLLSAWIHNYPCGQIYFCIYTKTGIFLKRQTRLSKQTDSKNKYMLNKVLLFCVFCQDHTSPFWFLY